MKCVSLYSVAEDYCHRRVAVAMGENMSKRLKLVSTTEADMEERSFPNQYPDWEQGLAVSNAGAELDSDEPLDAEGKVGR